MLNTQVFRLFAELQSLGKVKELKTIHLNWIQLNPVKTRTKNN